MAVSNSSIDRRGVRWSVGGMNGDGSRNVGNFVVWRKDGQEVRGCV